MALATSLYHLLATPWSSHPIAGRSTSPRNRHAVPPRHGLRIPLRRAPPVCGLCSLPQADPATDLGFDLGFGIWDLGLWMRVIGDCKCNCDIPKTVGLNCKFVF
ncbi:hypothetical protein BRADI_5g21492v3 [Brachypodium distachyon]|uniref:Uncharacterized protein n=1 Tax=Brachypodium distachyon TaxID=15368 RepID=A0A2K2CII4_BRADI|nr:hypothetical protein BRADI_5g21492v3 [Brachypodium distachyon]